MLLNTALLAAAGFFIYGPQALAAVIVVKLATKRAAATAVGLTSIFGYASTVVTGWGLGTVAQHYGWDYVFISLLGLRRRRCDSLRHCPARLRRRLLRARAEIILPAAPI